jgi:hypothetical protein
MTDYGNSYGGFLSVRRGWEPGEFARRSSE